MEHYEIERKYLIVMPDETWLRGCPGCRKKEIVQTYLTAEPGWERRVRQSTENGVIRYTVTQKEESAGLVRCEREREISEREYMALLEERDPHYVSLYKTRVAFPYEGHVMEIDRYPFWQEQAVLEVELSAPEEPFSLPSEITVLREVTEDANLRNHALALAATLPL